MKNGYSENFATNVCSNSCGTNIQFWHSISLEKNDVHEKPTLMNTCLELEDISFGIPSSDYKKNALKPQQDITPLLTLSIIAY